MKPFRTVRGQMAPLPRAHVDTDQIIPKQFLKRIERHGYGPFLFYDWRFDLDGEEIDDFVLNRPEYTDAKVLICGPNFGSGSSREHAAWSLQDWGFEAFVAPSFGDIFYNNSINIGLLPVILPLDAVTELQRLADDPGNDVVVNLESQTVTCDGFQAEFDIDPHVRDRLLAGRDNIAETLLHEDAIGVYEATRAAFKPVLG